jgi:PAS domain S-box-containing protein
MLDHSGEILLVVDPVSLHIAAASGPTLRLLGYRREGIVGRRITDIECGLADAAYWDALLKDGPAEGQAIEADYLRANGESFIAVRTVSCAADGDKQWLVVRAAPRELPRQADDELARVSSRLQATLEATAEGILLVDRSGGIINMNQRFSRIWGLPQALLIEHDDSLIFGFMAGLLADPNAYHTGLAAISPKADYETFDVLHLADGRIFERRSMPARNADHIFGRVFSFADITERSRTEAAHVQLEAQLRESQKMEALGTLAGGVAHDFNNIVATIMGNVELSCRDVGSAHAALESLEEIRKASRRAKELVRQILAFGRRQTLQLEVMSLEPVLKESTRFLRAMLPAGVALTVECRDEVPAVLADANQIQQVLLNLCGNAWQAVMGQARTGVIEIRLEERIVNEASNSESERRSDPDRIDLPPGCYVSLSVRDNGCGMDAGTRARIFEPFFTTKPVGEGTGLGLSVVHSIVKDHDASIEVRSRPGEGTTFRIYFPAAAAPACAQAREGRAARAAAGGEACMPQGEGRHILYVDDDEAIIFLMTRLLQRQGYRVSGYTDPRSAIAAVREAPAQFDLAVTDFNMPGMSGLDVVGALRAIRADLPMALASGYITEELRAKASIAGVDELIYKPNTVDELCEAVARLAATTR